MNGWWAQPSTPLLVGVVGGLLGSASALAVRFPAVPEEAQFLLWLLGISLAYIALPMVAVTFPGSVTPNRISTQFMTGLLAGMTVVILGILLVPEANLQTGWLDATLLLSISLFSGGLIVAVSICEIGANSRSERPTAIGRPRSAPFLKSFGAFLASAVLLALVPAGGAVLSNKVLGHVADPSMIGSLVLAYVLAPCLVLWIRPRGSFEGNAILMAWGAALAVGSAWVVWFAWSDLALLETDLWFQPLPEVGVVAAFTLWLAPGLLLSLAILARLHQRPAVAQDQATVARS